MGSLLLVFPLPKTTAIAIPNHGPFLQKPTKIDASIFSFPAIISAPAVHKRFPSIRRCCFHKNTEKDGDEEVEDSVEDLRVPKHWLNPSKALEESEWLRVTLLKWLDDEYCPEETNIEISKVAACSYYKSLLEKQTDLGEILLKMVRELESVSYQESFHGAFSSANAAVDLITQRIEKD